MVDAWEFMGRLATDDNFRDAFRLGNGLSTTAYARVSPTGHAKIPMGDYPVVREMFWQFAGRKSPISLMALGDMLWSRQLPNFLNDVDKLAEEIKRTGMTVVGRSPDFYIGLGAMILDDSLRSGGSGGLDRAGFVDLQQQDRQNLLTLASTSDVKTAMLSVCSNSWRPDCSLRVIEWDGHLHPVANGPADAKATL